jgi:NAD+ kinase
MRLAVRGDDEAVADAVDAAGAALVDEPDAELVVAVDDAGLVSLAADPPASPVLPVAAGEAYHSVPRTRVREAVAAVAADEHRLVDGSLLSVSLDESPVGRAVADVTLMTAAPAKISEYAVHADDERVEQMRADGVVVATPVGSTGYARSAGGPVVGVDAGLSVVPVAPFATLSDAWVLSPPLGLTVERDEGDVSLYLDDESVATVTTDTRVRVERGPPVSFVRVPGTSGRSLG